MEIRDIRPGLCDAAFQHDLARLLETSYNNPELAADGHADAQVRYFSSSLDKIVLALGAYQDSKCIGAIFITRSHSSDGSYNIAGFFVDETHTKKGVGRTLLEQALDQLRRQNTVTFNVHAYAMRPARNLLMEHGFHFEDDEPDCVAEFEPASELAEFHPLPPECL